MNLLLFEAASGAAYPVIETTQDGHEAVDRPGGENQLRKKVHRAYQGLKARLDYHERLCAQLRFASRLDVYHPTRLEISAAEQKIRDFFLSCHKKHNRWLWTDALVSGAGVFLTPIPGPNVIFYYAAARTIGHYLARKGARTLLELNSTSFHPEPLIDRVQQQIRNLKSARHLLTMVEQRFGVRDLEKILSRLGEL